LKFWKLSRTAEHMKLRSLRNLFGITLISSISNTIEKIIYSYCICYLMNPTTWIEKIRGLDREIDSLPEEIERKTYLHGCLDMAIQSIEIDMRECERLASG